MMLSMSCAMEPMSVTVSAEAAHIEAHLDIFPLVTSIKSIEALIDHIKMQIPPSNSSDPAIGKLAKWVVGQIINTIDHTKTTLHQLGFANSRYKRSPFGFIGSISSTLFDIAAGFACILAQKIVDISK